MRIPLPYKTSNRLQQFLKMEQARRTLQTGEKIKLYDIETELGAYCSLTREAIYSIKRGTSIASLPVAMKISEFFETTIEQIFNLVDGEEKQIDVEEENEEDEVEQISLV